MASVFGAPRVVRVLVISVAVAAALASTSRAAGVIWRVQPSPAVEGALDGVSCTSASWCVAVGATYGPYHALIERWNGRRWSLEAGARPVGNTPALSSVSCASRRACMAVGSISTSAGEEPFAEYWDGKRWSIKDPPSLGTIGPPASVSCTSATVCTAVGGSSVWRWDGTRWTGQTLAQVGGGNLDGVSCTSSSSCAAVVQYALPHAAAARWDGMSWTIDRTPPLGDLTGVSCTSATACIAVGDKVSGGGGPVALAWNGQRWSRQATPGTFDDVLLGVSCASSNSCTAVGFKFVEGTYDYPRAEQWNGHRWSWQTIPHTAGAPNSGLVAVSCTSRSVCIAVGDCENGNRPLIEQSTLPPAPVCRDPDRDHDCD